MSLSTRTSVRTVVTIVCGLAAIWGVAYLAGMDGVSAEAAPDPPQAAEADMPDQKAAEVKRLQSEVHSD